MQSLIKKIALSLVLIGAVLGVAVAQQPYFFPKTTNFDPAVPTPEAFLGYPIGSHYTRHDRIVAYFRELERTSNRVHVRSIGKTYEEREQVIVTFTSPDNYGKLEQIRQEHLSLIDPAKPAISASAPVVVLLGYSVHGNESSSGEVSLLTGYYLAANKDAETLNWLKESVIFIDPSLNPDGRDRAANWYNSYKSFPSIADGNDKEHQEQWPGGRTNHYFADLNRDWLNLVHVESRNRVAFFHQWYPNVQIDFHEQGANATYYFEPTPKRHESPVIPQFLYDQNAKIAAYHAKALDEIGSLYFTKENYDNLSPIYGSTYPKFFGSLAATFEQASSGGLVRETTNGLLTFPFTIRNHLATSFSTIRAAIAEKPNLFKVQKDLFRYAIDQAKASATKGYVFGDAADQNLTQKFLELLLTHRVVVHELPANQTIDGKNFEKGKAYVVPSEQPNYLIVHSLFEENILADSLFYDNTGWSIIHAYGLQYAKLGAANLSKGAVVSTATLPEGGIRSGRSSYAYIAAYNDFNASKLLYQALDAGLLVKAAYKPFTAQVGNEKKAFSYGSLIIPVEGQSLPADSVFNILDRLSKAARVTVYPVSTGFSAAGIDLGSSNIKSVKKPEVALAFGQGVTTSEAGQIWFLLSHQLGIPVVKIDPANFSRVSLKRYTTLILPGGTYAAWDKPVVDKIKAWVAEGGTLITFQAASAWAIQQELVRGEKLLNSNIDAARSINAANLNTVQRAQESGAERGAAAEAKKPERYDFVSQQDREGARRINGAIFEADIDITHPIAFGLSSRKLFINKNGSTLIAPSSTNPFGTVAQYVEKPFVNGYAAKRNIAQVSNSAAIIHSSSGSGQVVLFADDPTYRSYWLGTARLFLNSVLLLTTSNVGAR
jgi:hypothetical protein